MLNESPKVSENSRVRVLTAIEVLGYQPNASARGLAANTTHTIALVFPKLSGPFFSALIHGAETEASRSNYHLLIFGASGESPAGSHQTLGMLTSKVDGLILASPVLSRAYFEDVKRYELPVVVLGEEPAGRRVDSLQPDNVGGAEMIVRHLIQHGYRRIAMIKGPADQMHANQRELGFRKALQGHKIACLEELMIPGAFTENSGYATMSQLLRQAPVPQAVFCANDQMAIGAMAAIHDLGLRVPQDIALAGFDDIETARYLKPPLTTVQQDMFGQGQLAVRMLLARVNGTESPVETKTLSTSMMIRRSCGCTPAAVIPEEEQVSR